VTALLLAAALVHESGVSSSRMELRGEELRVTFTFSLEDLAGLARLDADRNGIVDPAEWASVLPAITAYIGDHFRIEGWRSEAEPGALPGTLRMSDPRAPVTLVLNYIPSTPLQRLKIRCDLFREHGGNPRHIAEFPGGEAVVFDNHRLNTERPIVRSGSRGAWIAAGVVAALGLLAAAYLRCR
jgi:hypothetical protein